MACKGSRQRHVVWAGDADAVLGKQLQMAGWSIVDAGCDGARIHAAMRDAEYAVGLVDLRHAGAERLTRLQQAITTHPTLRWIALVCVADLESLPLSSLVGLACFDFFTDPIDGDRLIASLGHAWGMARLGAERAGDVDEVQVVPGMVGASSAMRELAGFIRKFAPVEVPVLITGETGTGKEVAAHALHDLSPRQQRPFVAINCGALPANLVQSELFGHERGSFTGATARKIGRFEAAEGGTVFLDEIGDLPLDAQTSLLRFLQEGTIERVGSCQSLRIDVRVMAATHVDLEQAVQQGRFREDLYYRLNVLRLPVPPLRRRGEDIARLARHFLESFRRAHGTRVRGFSDAALMAMAGFPWPGNVRELMNRVRRAAVVSEGTLITPADMELDEPCEAAPAAPLDDVRASAERDVIVECLRQSRFNVSECARRLKVSRVTVYRLCKKHQVALDGAR